MSTRFFRLLSLFFVLLAVVSTSSPVLAAACPTLQCGTVINYCQDFCGGVRAYSPVGTCTAADGSTKTLWVVGCYCGTWQCVNG